MNNHVYILTANCALGIPVLLGLAVAPMRNAEAIEVTGLVDLGACRVALVRFEPRAQTVLLKPGEQINDVTLMDLDARAGWALFESGTNRFKLAVTAYCGSIDAPAQTQVSPPVTRPRRTSSAEASLNSAECAPTVVARQCSASFDSLGTLQADFSAIANGTTPAPSSASEPAKEAQQTFTVPAGAAVAPPAASASAPVPDGQGGSPISANPDPIKAPPANSWAEGERIRLLYGQQAFLAWDMARGK